MTKFYKVLIDKTYKVLGSKEGYRKYDTQVENFNTVKEAKDFILATYKQHKRVKMYIDTKEGEIKHTGWIYSFKNSDYEEGKKYHFWESHWITLKEVKETIILY